MKFDRTAEEFFRTRMRQFFMMGLRGRTIQIQLGDTEYFVGESDYMGLFRGVIAVSNEQIESILGSRPEHGKWLTFRSADRSRFEDVPEGQLQLIESTGISIISDVDDTIKHSNVPNRRDLFRNTFIRNFVPVAGMPELYRVCAAEGAAFHFVSGSPWQLFEPLQEFLKTEGYPSGSFHLKRFRIRDSAKKLRPSPQKAHKRAAIEPLLDAFPKRRFILIGDSGEQDSEIYSGIVRDWPNQVVGIFIRAIRGESRTDVRFQTTFATVDPDRWFIYRDPCEIAERVTSLVYRDR
ncbi:MAG: DUF2183 domain-containing protein [Planctomycetes bacterium]|nr:DUF2183 domain-containing protein [Planctomycetota bacterium]